MTADANLCAPAGSSNSKSVDILSRGWTHEFDRKLRRCPHPARYRGILRLLVVADQACPGPSWRRQHGSVLRGATLGFFGFGCPDMNIDECTRNSADGHPKTQNRGVEKLRFVFASGDDRTTILQCTSPGVSNTGLGESQVTPQRLAANWHPKSDTLVRKPRARDKCIGRAGHAWQASHSPAPECTRELGTTTPEPGFRQPSRGTC
jgi:hypothetical protein